MFFKRPFLVSEALMGAVFLAGISWAVLQNDKGPSARSVEFTEKVSIPLVKGDSHLRVWIPVPINDAYQKTEILHVESSYPYRMAEDKDFGNRVLYFEAEAPAKVRNIEIEVLYKINRKEQRGLDGAPHEAGAIVQPAFLVSAYLEPRGLEVINGEIRTISEELTKGLADPLGKARAIYGYVLKHMRYDKSGTGWGRGDSIYACDIGKGNCTDFHSLFIVLARASRIPARFRMGIPLPESTEGEPDGFYHCWAEFYIEGKGWIPVDISEAWKNPQKAEYFFGNLDPNRVLISTGRDILLSPRQKGAPLNYLSRPYVEINGRPVNDFKLERRYKDNKV